MRVVESGNFYELEFDYNPRLIKDIKAIPGRWWNSGKKVWMVPRDAAASIEWLIRKYQGHSAPMQPESFATVPPLPELTIDIPLKRPLYDYQGNGVAYCLEKKRVIMGDEPGLGKTSQAIAAIVAQNAFPALIICSIKAAGVGITLTASSRVAFVELPWHAADADQCEDRCHRIGQKDSVQCTYFLGKETIDEDIYKIIEDKRSMANTITGSDDNIQKQIIDKITGSLFKDKVA